MNYHAVVKNRRSMIESNVIFLCLGLPPASAAAAYRL